MSGDHGGDTVARLRRVFDESFARAVVLERKPQEDLLLLRAGESHFALRSLDTAGLLRCPPLTAVPSGQPALCGIAGVRGTLVAVYDLAVLAGEGDGPGTGGWMVVSSADHSAALRFDELVGYRRVAAEQIHAAPAANARGAARQVVRLDGVDRTLIHVRGLLEHVANDWKRE